VPALTQLRRRIY